MGMLRERLTFENFSMMVHAATKEGSENVHVPNMLWDISFVNTATNVPPMSGPNEGVTETTEGCVKSRKSTRKLPVILKYSGSTRLRNTTVPRVDSENMLGATWTEIMVVDDLWSRVKGKDLFPMRTLSRYLGSEMENVSVFRLLISMIKLPMACTRGGAGSKSWKGLENAVMVLSLRMTSKDAFMETAH